MATSYPAGLDSFTNPTSSDSLDTAGVLHDEQHANANDAIEAIEAELGTAPSGSFSTVKDRIAEIDGNVLITAGTQIRVDDPFVINGDQSASKEQFGIVDTRTNSTGSTAYATLDISGTLDYSTGSSMSHRSMAIVQNVDLNGGITMVAAYALNFTMTLRGSGTVTNGAGINANLVLNDDGTDNAPTVTTGKAVDALISVQAGSVGGSDNPTITTAIGVDVTTTASSGSGFAPNGVITTAIGLRMTSLAANTSTSGALSGGTVWGMQVGDYQSYHTGRLALGGTTAPTYQLELQGTGADRGALYFAESSATPTNPPASAGVVMYHKADRIIFAFLDGATMRYKSLLLTGTGTTWSHATSAP